ncbi:hypothetical protein D3C75_1054630 [compost metagenome]
MDIDIKNDHADVIQRDAGPDGTQYTEHFSLVSEVNVNGMTSLQNGRGSGVLQQGFPARKLIIGIQLVDAYHFIEKDGIDTVHQIDGGNLLFSMN